MKFAIRDDDTNYFTQPEDLIKVYGKVWNKCPISLAVIPFQKCTKSGAIPKKYWQGNKTFPIDENKKLIEFLKKKLTEGKVSIMLHGYSHKDTTDGYEFDSDKYEELYRKVKEGKKYLEDIFKVEIKAFVPPHNIISRSGLKAVIANELNLVNIPSFRLSKRPFTFKTLENLIKRRYYFHRYGHPYPYLLKFEDHKEIAYKSLTPQVNFKHLKAEFDFHHKVNGVFCLATHYWEFESKMVYNNKLKMGDIFEKFWHYINGVNNVKFYSVNELFRGG